MSYIIDQFAASPLWQIDPHSSSSSHANLNVPGLSEQPQQAQREALLSALAKHKGKFLSLVTSHDQFSGQLLIPGERQAIFTIKTKRQRGVFIQVRLLTPDGKPLAIRSRAQRLIFCKLVSVRSLEFSQQVLKLQVNMRNGEMRLDSPAYHLDEAGEVERVFSVVLGGVRECMKSWPINFATQISQTNENSPVSRQDVVTRQLYYYSQFTNTFINLSLGPNSEELFLVDQQVKEAKAISSLKSNYISPKLKSGQSLFSLIDADKIGSEIFNYDIPVLQRDNIISETTLGKVEAPTTAQVPYVLSHIQLGNTGEHVKLEHRFTGGFSSIFLASTVEYKYVQSFRTVGQPSEPLKGYPPQKKEVIVKRDRPGCRVSRVAHERRILQHIKCGMARFLPSYYIVTDQGSCFAEDLLMDHIRHPNLSRYIQQRKESISLQSKIFLLSMMVQALRYLQTYRIVHLDLKPENVMMSRNLSIKLIDFGEAYHPQVKGHRRGFSAPYSAPEIYLLAEQYSYKSDVFSLGIILHELVFGFVPFVVYDDMLRHKAYLRSAIHNYWMWAPEQAMNFGQRTTLPILRLLIGKCLSPNPAERPQLEWIILVLRKCIKITWG